MNQILDCHPEVIPVCRFCEKTFEKQSEQITAENPYKVVREVYSCSGCSAQIFRIDCECCEPFWKTVF